MNPNFKPKLMTGEERVAASALKEVKKAYALEHLKTEYADADHWRTLAQSNSLRMPLWYFPATDTKYLKRMARKTNTDIDSFVTSTGFSTLKNFMKANPKLTAFALCGLFLEFVTDKDVYTETDVE